MAKTAAISGWGRIYFRVLEELRNARDAFVPSGRERGPCSLVEVRGRGSYRLHLLFVQTTFVTWPGANCLPDRKLDGQEPRGGKSGSRTIPVVSFT